MPRKRSSTARKAPQASDRRQGTPKSPRASGRRQGTPKSPIRVLTIAKLSGGIGRHVACLQAHSRHKFFSLAYSDVPIIPIPVLRALSFLFFGFFFGLNSIRKNRIQLIHAHYLLPSGLLGLFLSRLTGKPLIVTVHGSDAYSLRWLDWLKHLVASNATVVCVSRTLAKDFPGEVVSNGVDVKELSSAKPIRLKRPAVLFVGALVPQKVGFLPEIIQRMPEANFYVIGDGPLADTIGGIELHNRSHSQLLRYYKSADCLISTSEWEGFGLAVLEAMAAGCPVIVRPVGALKELVQSRGAFASTPEEFVIKLRKIIKGRPATAGAKAYARRFTWAAAARKTDRIYETAVGSRGRQDI